jgi:excisionase family DNA binding protein
MRRPLLLKVLPRPFYSTLEVSRIFQVNYATVRLWVREGLLPAIVTPGSGRLRFRHDAVLAFAQRHGQPPVGLAGDVPPVLLEPVTAPVLNAAEAPLPPPAHPVLPERATYSTNEVAALLRLHPRTVRGLCDQGLIVSYRSGLDRHIPRECLDAFLKGRGLSPALLDEPPMEESA